MAMMITMHGKFHEDDEHSNASYVRILLFYLPVGLGIYWIASAVVRSIQQLLINRHLNKMNIDDLVNENMRKMEAKRSKRRTSASEDHKPGSSECQKYQ